MNNKIYPCLWFDQKAKDAAEFYCSVFDESMITSENPMVVLFELEGVKFMGLNGGPIFKINPSISFFVTCDSEHEINRYWNALSIDGNVMMPLNTYPWSEKYGWCSDKFGVNWQLMIGKVGDAGQKIIPNLMFTKENNGKAEEAINFYTNVFPASSVYALNKYEKGESDTEGNIKHSQFKLYDQWFTAMDSSAPHDFKFNEAISLVIPCDDQKEIDFYWEKLTSNGGKESQCGWLVDPFGVSWQVVPSILGRLMAEKGQSVIDAFMKMKKFDIATLENA